MSFFIYIYASFWNKQSSFIAIFENIFIDKRWRNFPITYNCIQFCITKCKNSYFLQRISKNEFFKIRTIIKSIILNALHRIWDSYALDIFAFIKCRFIYTSNIIRNH